MTDRSNPLRVFTRGIAEAIEGGPTVEGMFSENGIIEAPWGHFATKAVELGLVEPDISVICDYFGIEQDDFANPEAVFTSYIALEGYEMVRRDAWEREYRLAQPTPDNLSIHLAAREEEWKVENGDEVADMVQKEITALAKSEEAVKNEIQLNQLRNQLDALCLMRQAYASGIAVSLPDFLDTVYGFEGETSFSQAEIARATSSMLENIMYDYLLNDRSTPVTDIILGREELKDFHASLQWATSNKARDYARNRWYEMRPLFVAPSYRQHSLFSGIAK